VIEKEYDPFSLGLIGRELPAKLLSPPSLSLYGNQTITTGTALLFYDKLVDNLPQQDLVLHDLQYFINFFISQVFKLDKKPLQMIMFLTRAES
jgi:hypothetical protein